MQEIGDIFEIWESITEMADDINQLPDTVYRWKVRGRIPEDMWPRVIGAAAMRKKTVTAQMLLRLNAPIKRRGRKRAA